VLRPNISLFLPHSSLLKRLKVGTLWPMPPAVALQATVVRKRELTPTVFELSFEVEPKIEFQAGQFISLIVPGAGPHGRDLRRAYSIASSPDLRPMQFCIKRVEGGPGTTYLDRLLVGSTFQAMGPYGDFVPKTPPERGVCFVATGTGIAPFRSMLYSSDFQKSAPNRPMISLFGSQNEKELLYVDEMNGVPGHRFVTALSRVDADRAKELHAYPGRVTDYLRAHQKDFPPAGWDFYLCGSSAMIEEVKTILMGFGFDKKQIHQEVYYKVKD
jgi:ferredoxin-NADP reductase